uniref:Endonuclease III homolog n=1 Tax=Globodera rostochiensis TaxID=31243 RepID=A0A914GX72_GLORO
MQKRTKTAAELEIEDCPSYNDLIETHIKLIRQMREKVSAPVDTMGCHMLADGKADPKTNRFQTLVALMLSSQTKDQITAEAMERLKKEGCTVENFITMTEKRLEDLLKPVGFYRRKAQYLKRVALILRDEYGGDIPNTFESLCSLPGVGPKMSNLALQIAFGKVEGIAVDTHVHRIANRLKWVNTNTPEQTEQSLKELLPKSEWGAINKLLVGFGQTICLPVHPKCDECISQKLCPWIDLLICLTTWPNTNRVQICPRNSNKMSGPETSDDRVAEDQAKKTDLSSKYAQWERLAKEWEIPEEGESGGVDSMFKKIYRDATDEVEKSGLKDLWALIDPIWKFEKEELVNYMAKRVVFESEDIIAFDKPFQLAVSSGPKDQAQLDRIFQLLKERIAPGIDRLYTVSPLDKSCTGVMIFAKSRLKQLELKALLAEDKFLFRFRCLCKNIPEEDKARISIPLIKVLKGSNMKLCPLIGTASRYEKVYHLNTDFKLVNECKPVHCSVVDAFVRRSLAHLVRSHLYYGLNCPIVGDQKYTKAHKASNPVLPMALSPNAMTALSLRKNDLRKMPMFMHCAVVHVPETKSQKMVLIRSEMPSFFVHALKRLRLLKK